MSEADHHWIVYMIRCDDGSLYTGVTTDLERRFNEHGAGKRGARYFAGRRPEAVVWSETGHDQSSALRREAAIKKLHRRDKLRLADSTLQEPAQGTRKSSP
jgi:putative endonuclease